MEAIEESWARARERGGTNPGPVYNYNTELFAGKGSPAP